MKITKLIILLCCAYGSLASGSHNIPVEEYSTELQDLGQHVEYKETPVRVIKITKTVAVKVPVPYPVKVVEKVPYPVHVAKPYPVAVPQIIRIPHESPAHAPQPSAHGDHTYNVHENTPSDDHSSHFSFPSAAAGQLGQEKGYAQAAEEQPYDYGGSFDSPSSGGLYGYADKEDGGSSYDAAIQQYLQNNVGNHHAGAAAAATGAHGYY